MTPERFHTIVETYGADARRWPQIERAEAEVWADTHRATADAWLAEAAELDTWLTQDRVAAPALELVERIVAGAPRAAGRRLVLGWFPRWSRGWSFWWPGAAFAGAGLAGGVAGAFAVSLLLLGGVSSGQSDPGYLTTGFGHAGSDWSIDAAGKFNSGNNVGNNDDMTDTRDAGDGAALGGNGGNE